MKNSSIFPQDSPASPPPAFRVRDVPVHGSAMLAPMDGYSDWPFRSLCRRLGSSMSYTEFVQAEHILRSDRYMRAKLHFQEGERPVVFQLYGDQPQALLRAAQKIQELGPDVIDINMGCPAKSVAGRGAGVGLMRTPLKVARLFRLLSRSLHVPVTAKIRLGWEGALNYKLIARIVEENGGSLVAVHARTREQNYRGPADWDAIAEVKSILSIPVVGNGDVRSPGDIRRMQDYTGCDGVMVGRAAIANPWIFSGRERSQVTPEQVRRMVSVHLHRNIQFYGAEDGPRLFRKHAVQYLMLRRLSRQDRKDLLRSRPSREFVALLSEIRAAI